LNDEDEEDQMILEFERRKQKCEARGLTVAEVFPPPAGAAAPVEEEDIAKADNYVLKAIEALVKGEKPAVASTDAYGCGVKYKN
jgi:hypothetical protein